VFEPFKRLHSADQYEGTGLGLATCRKIVQRHGGEIWCDAAESGGTVFWFTLPQSTTVESRV
jgi:signal transduction histidine kinase